MKVETPQQGWDAALYSAFYRMSLDCPVSGFYFFIQTLALLSQEMSFSCSLTIQGSSLLPLEFFSGIRSLWVTGTTNNTLYQVSAYFISILVLGNIFYLVVLIHFYTSRRCSTKPPRLLSWLGNSHIQWSSGPLFVPYVTIISDYIFCNEMDNPTLFNPNPAEVVYFFIILAIHTLVSILYLLSVMTWSPLKRERHTKAHSRASMFSLLFQLVSCLLTTFLQQNEDSLTALGVLIYLVLAHSLLAAMYFYELPFYSSTINQVYLSIYSISSMTSLSVLLRFQVIDSGDSICVALFFICSCLLLPSAYVLVNWRLKKVGKMSLDSLSTDTEWDIWARMKMITLMDCVNAANSLAQGELVSRNGNYKKGEIEFPAEKELALAVENATKELDGLLCVNCQQQIKAPFKKSLARATYAYYFKGNRLLAMQHIRQALREAPMFFDMFPLQVRMRSVAEWVNQENNEEDQYALETYEEQQRLYKVATHFTNQCRVLHLRFWGTLATKDYSLAALEALSEQIYIHSETAKNSLQKLILLNPRNASFRRLYSQFLSHVMNDESSAKRQLSKALELESDPENSQMITDTSNCIIILSCEKETFGQIMDVNDKASQVFGITVEEMVGRKINSFMARPYAHFHSNKLENYIEHGIAEQVLGVDTTLLDSGATEEVVLPASASNTFAASPLDAKKETHSDPQSRLEKSGLLMHSMNGFIFEGDLRIREYIYFGLEPTMTLLGCIQPHPDKCQCVIRKCDLVVVDVSSLFFQHFQPNMEKMKTQDYSVLEVFPVLKDEIPVIRASLGNSHNGEPCCLSFPTKSGDRQRWVPMKISNLKYVEKEYWLMEIELESYFEKKMDLEQEGGGEGAVVQILLESKAINEIAENVNPEIKLGDIQVSRECSSTSESETGSQEHEQREPMVDSEKKDHESSSITSSKSNVLLRMNLLKAHHRLERHLGTVLLWLMLLSLVLSVLAICNQAMSATLSGSRYLGTLQLLIIPVRTGTFLALYSTVMYGHIFRNTFSSLNSSLFSNHGEDLRIRRDLNKYMTSMGLFRSTVYSNQDIGLALDVEEYIKNADASIVYDDGQFTRIKVVEFTTYFQNGMNSILHLNVSQLRSSASSPLNFFRNNMNSDMAIVWEDIRQKVMDSQMNNMATVSWMGMTSMLAALSLTLLAVLFVFLPSLMKVQKRKMRLFYFFANMDKENLASIYQRCFSKWVESQGEDEAYNNYELQDISHDIQTHTTASFPTTTKVGELQLATPPVTPRTRMRPSLLMQVLQSRSLVVLLSTVAVTAVYFMGYYVWWVGISNSQLKGIDERVVLSRSRHYYVRKIVMEFMSYSDQLQMFTINETLIEQLESDLYTVDHALYFGDPAFNVNFDVRVYPGGELMLGGDVCQLFQQNNINTYNTTPCETFGNGVLKQGAHAVILYFISLSQTLRQIYHQNDSVTYRLKLLEVKAFGDNWIPYMCSLFDSWFLNISQAEFSSALEVRIAGTIAFVLIWLGMMLFVYIPWIGHLKLQLQKAAQLLGLFPNDTLESCKAIAQGLKNLLREDER